MDSPEFYFATDSVMSNVQIEEMLMFGIVLSEVVMLQRYDSCTEREKV